MNWGDIRKTLCNLFWLTYINTELVIQPRVIFIIHCTSISSRRPSFLNPRKELIALIINPFHQPILLGLDIQPEAIRIVQIKRSRGRPIVLRFIEEKLDDSILIDDKLQRYDLLTARLIDLVKRYGLQRALTAACLPASQVIMRTTTMPAGAAQPDILAEIHAHLERDLPGLKEKLCIDFEVLTSKNQGVSEIHFVAAKLSAITQFVEALQAADLRPRIMDVDLYALKRAVCYLDECSHQPVPVPAAIQPAFMLAYGLAVREIPVW